MSDVIKKKWQETYLSEKSSLKDYTSSLVAFWNTSNRYDFLEQSDLEAIKSDWEYTGNDIREALLKCLQDGQG